VIEALDVAASGEGNSRRVAETAAARAALDDIAAREATP